MNFINWINAVMRDGLSGTTHRFYSMYLATVDDNKDPKGLGRIKIVCSAVGHKTSPDVWVLPSMQGAGYRRGTFFAPEKGDTVYVNFYEGDPSLPQLYFGGWYGETDGAGKSDLPDFMKPPASNLPEKKGIFTRAGHMLIFNDEVGKEAVTLIVNQPKAGDPALTDRTKTADFNPSSDPPAPAFPGQKLGASILTMDKTGFLLKTPSSFVVRIDETTGGMLLAAPNGAHFAIMPDGAVQMVNKSGVTIMATDKGVTVTADPSQNQTVNVSAKSVSLNAGAINLGAQAAEMAVLGLKLIVWLAKHTHPYPFGVTLPPLPPPTPADFCSTTVKMSPK